MDDLERMQRNQQAWDLRTQRHFESDFYDVDSFKRGRNTLRPFEQEALGDVRGKSLLHLMCHFGMDTLSWARLGARVTGVDFSQESIAAANDLARELTLDARFIQSNVYDLKLKERFDVVVTTYGVLPWLPDLDAWARVVARCLKPGGTFFLAEFHPMLTLFDDDLALSRSYFRTGAADRMSESYAGGVVHDQSTWPWTIAGLVSALGQAGLTIERLTEVPRDLRQRHPRMVPAEDGLWRLPGDPLPLLVTCEARLTGG